MCSKRSLSFTVGLALATCFAAMAQEQPKAPDEAQIRSWIAALANSSPQRKFLSPNDRLTKQEREALKPVNAAYANLSKHFVATLPHLMESLDDKRFSYPQEHPSSAVFENQSVGDACRSIIQRKVLLRNPVLADARDIAVWHHMPLDKDWYARVKGMSLFEMQVDALDWLLKQPPPAQVSPAQWTESLTRVRKFREEFVAKGEPVDRTLAPPIEGK